MASVLLPAVDWPVYFFAFSGIFTPSVIPWPARRPLLRHLAPDGREGQFSAPTDAGNSLKMEHHADLAADGIQRATSTESSIPLHQMRPSWCITSG